MDAVAEIKSRLNIEDVIGEYVVLKRMGRNFKGLSPWTHEKTASFIVSPEKQIWHDFSSSRGGDMFSFVMEMEGLDFRGALEHLARKAGIDLEQFAGAKAGTNSKLKIRASEALTMTARFYQKQLTGNQKALSYLLKDRKFSKKTILDWQLGYSPNTGGAIHDFLSKKGFDSSEMKMAGLVVERRGRIVDMFYGRIMIPLQDSRGQVVGFTARLLEDNAHPSIIRQAHDGEPSRTTGSGSASPKYINTPSTPLYDKSRHVFGLHLAKDAIRKAGFVVVVEGNMDVIASHQAGVTNVVATAGTAMTLQHLRELKRFTGDIRLCFDTDRAGIEATERIIPMAQQVEVNLNIIDIVGAKDPDELIAKNKDDWVEAINQFSYATDWLINRYKAELDLNSASGKKAFTDALLVTVGRLNDPVEKEHYLKIIAKEADTSLEAVQAKLDKSSSISITSPTRKMNIQPQVIDQNSLEYQMLQDHLLANLLMQPKLRYLLNGLEAEFFIDPPKRKVLEFLKKFPDFRGEPVAAKELQDIADYVKIISLQFEELYQDLSLDDSRLQAANLKKRLIERYVKTQKQQIAANMQHETDEQKLKAMMQKANQLNKLINSIKSSEEL